MQLQLGSLRRHSLESYIAIISLLPEPLLVVYIIKARTRAKNALKFSQRKLTILPRGREGGIPTDPHRLHMLHTEVL